VVFAAMILQADNSITHFYKNNYEV
jgi:hypothetical protein